MYIGDVDGGLSTLAAIAKVYSEHIVAHGPRESC